MKRLLSVLVLLVIGSVVYGATPPLHGGEHAAMTVKGEILDMACFVAHESKGPDHAQCALRCVKEGQPMGLLADDGKVFLLYANHKDSSAFEQAKEFAGKRVEITGKSASRSGFVGIEVLSVKEL